MNALRIHAGPRARQHLRDHGLRARDIAALPAAAGGPKGLVLNAIDRWMFGRFLPEAGADAAPVHLLGASIGAWRMVCACMPDPGAAFDALADDYVSQRYEHEPGRRPTAQHVSDVFGATLQRRFAGCEGAVLSHPRYRLHVFTSRGRHLLGRDGRRGTRLSTPLGWLGAYAANAVSRRALGGWLERVVFSDPRDALPIPLHGFRTRQVPLTPANLQPAVLASCSIPFWLEPVRHIPGAPPGPYWDGGLTDYHLHLDYAAMVTAGGSADAARLVLYPHFQARVVPGWLDKAWRRRHRATPALDNLVLLSPDPAWVAKLPNGKLPDRDDFRHYGDDVPARAAAWRRAIGAGQQLADELAALAQRPSIEAVPLD